MAATRRHFIIYHLPNLRFLDSSPITSSERDEALRRCFWMSQTTLNQLNRDTGNNPTGNNLQFNSYLAGPANGIERQNGHARSNADREWAASGGSGTAGSTGTGQEQPFRLTIMSDNSAAGHQPKGALCRMSKDGHSFCSKSIDANRLNG
jgi:hypothetical protein